MTTRIISSTKRQPPQKRSSHIGSLTWILICFLSSAVSFYGGIFVGWNMQMQEQTQQSETTTSTMGEDCSSLAGSKNEAITTTTTTTSTTIQDIFPKEHVGHLIAGIGHVNRDDFASKFDMGVPLDPSFQGNDHVTILYNSLTALPDNDEEKQQKQKYYYDNVDEATKNCENLHVILTHTGRERQCVAIMGQYESFHIQKFMRLPPTKGKVDLKYPLKLVNRGSQSNGRQSARPPTKDQTIQHWKSLSTYIDSLDDVLSKLDPIAQKVASHNENNAVIVMVCNFGQSELLLNFVCNAQRKGLGDVLKNVLLFATDNETKELAESLGLATFFDEQNFGRMPKNAARAYADKVFMEMMAAKVYCVQMISMLGYDLLFQDVDVIWYST